ncbi:hypothetical protein ACFP81_06355 [Deinococcus lacus]|uniref:Phage tail protein n=1 Tax=Deinococcus lacus TaxID=392561 RepID=A0ABW1YBP7_9DEIO
MTDLNDPANWPPISFVLADETGAPLVPLPPTVGFGEPLGRSDPYTWERSPGSSAWFPLGDGLPAEPPRVLLSGTWTYRTPAEALAHTADIAAKLPQARRLHWLGRRIADLRPDLPGTYQYRTAERYIEVTHELRLNLTAALDVATLAAAQSAPALSYTTLNPAPGPVQPGGTTPTLTTQTITIDGVSYAVEGISL